jgi:predicted ATPase
MRGEVKEDVLKSMGEGMNSQLRKMKKDYGENMNAFSHGEAYLKILHTRINGKGIYILDEPEAALSPLKQLSIISLIMEVTKNYKSQFIIATHSPIIMGLPGAFLYEIKEDGIHKTDFRDTEHYTITRSFLENPV